MHMELIADDRESAIIPFLDATVKRITVGDYVIMCGGKIILVIERKTYADLAASIKDGRMRNNKKLIDARAESGCKIMYIIEGKRPGKNKKVCGIPYKNLEAKLDSLFWQDIHIIFTQNKKHTAKRITDLFTMASKKFKPAGDKHGGHDIITRKHTKPNGEIRHDMIRCLKKVGEATARVALKAYSIQQLLLCEMTEMDCFNLRYENGNKLKSRGVSLFRECKNLDKKTKIKILACIPGVTAPTASKILSSVQFSRLICGNEKIAHIMKTESRAVGPKLEEKILSVFA